MVGRMATALSPLVLRRNPSQSSVESGSSLLPKSLRKLKITMSTPRNSKDDFTRQVLLTKAVTPIYWECNGFGQCGIRRYGIAIEVLHMALMLSNGWLLRSNRILRTGHAINARAARGIRSNHAPIVAGVGRPREQPLLSSWMPYTTVERYARRGLSEMWRFNARSREKVKPLLHTPLPQSLESHVRMHAGGQRSGGQEVTRTCRARATGGVAQVCTAR